MPIVLFCGLMVFLLFIAVAVQLWREKPRD
jgi:hypothetical protein